MDMSVYEKVYKLGMKEYRNKTMKGEYPYLGVLDEILSHTEVAKEQDLGLVDIPIAQIVGTKTEGRTYAFASNFMPLLPADSEFAYKWMNLYESHLQEGIHDPIKAYEFLNRFYVMEGNKRVSVLKYCDAITASAQVTRIIPKPDESEENKIYYEFLDFYDKTKINYLNFTQIGSYSEILKIIGVEKEEDYTEELSEEFNSAFIKFATAFFKKKGEKLSLTVADAFLVFLRVHDLDEFSIRTSETMMRDVEKLWPEFAAYPNRPEVKLITDAGQDDKRVLLGKKLWIQSVNSTLKVAFIHAKTTDTSSWTYGHDLGANHLAAAFGDKVKVSSYYEADTQEQEMERFEQAIQDGNTVIFSTSQKLVGTSMKFALDYPKISFLNCSLNTNSKYIRTYYGRLHEAKFLMGVLAGIMAPNNAIGYIADYPIYGGIANINAFALGARMVNPKIKVYLRWFHLHSPRQDMLLHDVDLSLISGQNFTRPKEESGKFGLYDARNESSDSLAMPVYDWGVYYEKTVQSILNGTWRQEADTNKYESLNDFWGMSSGLIDVILSKTLPPDTVRLIKLLKKGICSGEVDPFAGTRYTKDGTHYVKVTDPLTLEEIITMDWLADNVVGFIPTMEELTEDARTMVEVQGVSSLKD
ncbi:MAG: BMP family ABC transporter substrate-binding protein [Eubacterium sp.]|nr:BMP family ABC transporter substrate-binding protein [Eubacterium sp.]